MDLSLYDLKTGNEVKMPSGYDEMTDRAYADYAGGTADERARRALLRQAMETSRFHRSTPPSGGTSTIRTGKSIRS